MKNPDEIMAEYLLKGGKMLSKACPECKAPLFEYKGDTFCVVCREKAQEKPVEDEKKMDSVAVPAVAEQKAAADAYLETGSLAEELHSTIVSLCTRARTERRPEDCLLLMESIERGVDVLLRLTRP
jgi:UPF0148 protein